MSLCSNNSNDVENAMDISYNVPFPGPTSLDMDVDMDVDAMSIVTDLEDNSNSMVIEGEVSLPPQIGGRGINGDEVAPDIISPLTPILSLIPSTPSGTLVLFVMSQWLIMYR